MMPLIILLTCFVLLLIINKLVLKTRMNLSHIGRISLAIMLLFTGISHFLKTDLMIEMIPAFLPLKRQLVYFTGLLEVLASIGLLTKHYSKLTGIMLIVFFLAVLPANIIGSIKAVNLGGMQQGINYLVFRIPLQLLFIFWAYYFGVRINHTH